MNDAYRDLFARDGHLTMLSLDRYDTGELDVHARHDLELHVEGCPRCRERLGVVGTPQITIAPRGVDGRSTGSATIAVLFGSAVAALAASTLVWLGASMWPSPQPAWHEPTDAALVAGSYTSVAHDESPELGDMDVEIAATRIGNREGVIATPRGEGSLAVIVLRGDEGTGDTDGEAEAQVVAVLSPPGAATAALVVPIPRRFAQDRIVAVFCPGPFTLEPGDTLAPDPGCVARERARSQ